MPQSNGSMLLARSPPRIAVSNSLTLVPVKKSIRLRLPPPTLHPSVPPPPTPSLAGGMRASVPVLQPKARPPALKTRLHLLARLRPAGL